MVFLADKSGCLKLVVSMCAMYDPLAVGFALPILRWKEFEQSVANG